MFLRLLNRLFELLVHFLRRWIDPWARPILNPLLRDHAARLLTWLVNLQRSRENVGLAEETQQPGEEQDVQTMIDEMRQHLVIDFPPGGFERAGNTKTHGLVQATFVVHDNLPENLRRGLFAAPKSYACWVRFSGPGPHIEPDIDDVGFASISVKVMGVAGPRIWKDEEQTQDFTAVCTPTFVTPDVKCNARLQYWSRRHLPSLYFVNPAEPHLLDMAMQGLWNELQRNPLGTTYYGCVPYLMGEGQAMQFSFWPMSDVPLKVPGVPFRRPPDNYLRDNMRLTLDRMDVEIEMRVQLQTDPFLMPIENNAVLWPVKLSPRIPVATLKIPRQQFDDAKHFNLTRNLKFNPWHCLPEHRPLGNQSRARKRMYDELAIFRQKMNAEKHIEPTPEKPFG